MLSKNIKDMQQSPLKKIKLRVNEEIQMTVRSSLWIKFWPIVLATFLILLSFFLIYPLFQFGWSGIIIFFVLLFAGLFVSLRVFVSYYRTVFMVTSQRLADIEQKGFFNYSVSEIAYGNVADVSYQAKGVIRSIFGLGDVLIFMKRSDAFKIKIPMVKNPERVVDVILLSQSKMSEAENDGFRAEYLLDKIRKKIGDEKFEALISD